MTRLEPRADLRELAGYHSPQLDVSVRLNTNESPYPPPREFVDAWCRALANAPLHRYPDRAAAELRSAIAARLGQPASRVFPANGSNEVLQTLLLTYGGPDRRALVFEPTYALHSHIARITGTAVVTAPRRDDFLIDPDHAVGVIEREQPDIVFVCSPNNPSGTVEPPATVEAVLAAAPGLVIVDEAYGEFAPSSALTLVEDASSLVVTRTYSKVWSLAALRLGFALAPEAIVAELDKVVLPYHLDVATQTAGVLALEHIDAMEGRVRHLIEERERLFVALDELDGVQVFPSGANFLLFRAAGRGHALWEAMVRRGILVRDFSNWPGVEDCLRVTVGTPEENDAFLAALGDALRERGAREGKR
jgi:histidinol-phosphate aminotransferase